MRARQRPGAGSVVGLALALVLLAVGSGVAIRYQGSSGSTPATASSASPTPTPRPSRTPLLPAAGPADAVPAPTGPGLAAAIDAVIADPALGGRLSVSVLDAVSGRPLLERDASALLVPASTAKIVTAVATLTVVDPSRRLRTRVLAGPAAGDVVLVGGGDTLLASTAAAAAEPGDANLDALAAQTAAARAGAPPVTRILVDDSLYSGPATGPGWSPSYVADGYVAPVSALSVDTGRVRPDRTARSADPAVAAATALAARLRSPGAPAPLVERGVAAVGAAELTAVQGPPVSSLVERMLAASDNDLAESLSRQVALAEGQPASFDGIARALPAASAKALSQAGVAAGEVSMVDGSGLSRLDAVAPGALSRLLSSVARDPGRLSPVLTGLPVAGFSGTLADRYRGGPAVAAAGVVRAKTGTLRGVSTLAGLVRTREGRLLAFGFAADGVPVGATLRAEFALDRLAAAFAACGCR